MPAGRQTLAGSTYRLGVRKRLLQRTREIQRPNRLQTITRHWITSFRPVEHDKRMGASRPSRKGGRCVIAARRIGGRSGAHGRHTVSSGPTREASSPSPPPGEPPVIRVPSPVLSAASIRRRRVRRKGDAASTCDVTRSVNAIVGRASASRPRALATPAGDPYSRPGINDLASRTTSFPGSPRLQRVFRDPPPGVFGPSDAQDASRVRHSGMVANELGSKDRPRPGSTPDRGGPEAPPLEAIRAAWPGEFEHLQRGSSGQSRRIVPI